MSSRDSKKFHLTEEVRTNGFSAVSGRGLERTVLFESERALLLLTGPFCLSAQVSFAGNLKGAKWVQIGLHPPVLTPLDIHHPLRTSALRKCMMNSL